MCEREHSDPPEVPLRWCCPPNYASVLQQLICRLYGEELYCMKAVPKGNCFQFLKNYPSLKVLTDKSPKKVSGWQAST